MNERPVINTRNVALALAADAVLVVVFVAIGRKSHDESGSAVGGTLKVAAPFLIALVLGWMLARGWKAPTAPATGLTVWLVTVAAGMVLRHFAFSRGTALAFIIVATCFNGLTLVGWRLLAQRWSARRAAAPL